MIAFFKAIGNMLRPYWVAVSFIFVAIAVQMGFKIAFPFAFQFTFDHVIPDRDLHLFGWLFGVLVAWWLVQAVLAIAQDIVAARTGVAAVKDLRGRMFGQLQLLPIDYFEDHASGDLMARFSVDLVAIEKACNTSIYIFFFSFFNVLISLALLFYIEWRLAAMTLLGSILSTILPRRYAGRAQQASLERQTEEGRLTSALKETLGTFNVLHAYNLWGVTEKSFDEKQKRFQEKAVQAHKLAAFVRRFGGQSAALLQVLILALGCTLVLQDQLTIGTLIGFLALLQNMVGATSHLTAVMPELLQATGAMNRVQTYLADTGAAEASNEDASLARLKTALAFKDVSFAYRHGDQVLHQLNFDIPCGRHVAIVGPSGCGKSTLLKLLLRFYEPLDGSIRWDGADVRDFSKTSLRNQISIVPQDTVLFDTSLAENIRMGQLDADDEAVRAAAEKAELLAVVEQLSDGFKTRVGEGGSHLSGGQRQRVAIARALLRDPALLVLDEATSALDPLTEKAIAKTLDRLAENHTIIAVTHRLSSAQHADLILVMQQGRIVQQGDHQTLLAQKGMYADLWRKQTGFTISQDGFRAECSPERLQQIHLFENLNLARRQHISSLLISEFFPNNRLVFKKGDLGDKFYILVSGQVEIKDIAGTPGGDKPTILESGDFFGEMALLDHAPRNATVRTLMPSLLLSLNQYRFRQLIQEIPELEAAIEKVAAQRRRVDG